MGIMIVKELGNSSVRNFGIRTAGLRFPFGVNDGSAAANDPKQLFTKNTGLC
jgi:hypothetical protein